MSCHEFDSIIIGAGAAGLYCCARLAFLSPELNIALIESNDRVGKKLMLTGSGRCNLTNNNLTIESYYTDDYDKLEAVLTNHSNEDVIDFFEHNLGVLTDIKDDLVYPATYRSSTVVDALRFYIKDRNVNLYTDSTVIKISNDGLYHVYTKSGEEFLSKTLVFATGGVSYPSTGSNGTGFTLASKMIDKSDLEPLRPSLVPLISSDKDIKHLSGTKIYSSISIKDEEIFSEGELLFTDNGISGIMVFAISGKVSRLIAQRNKPVVVINLLKKSEEEIFDLINNRVNIFPERSIIDALSGVLRNNILEVVIKRTSLNIKQKISDLNQEQIRRLAHIICNFELNIIGTGDIKDGQITSGGIKLQSLSHSMEYKNSGLYFIGEMVNVDGICGGFNLQWAMSSADICAKAISDKVRCN